MCGIFGQFTTNPDPSRVRLLALLNQGRGKDAIGLLGADVNGNGKLGKWHWWKRAISPTSALKENTAEISRLAAKRLVLGHTRLGTKGKNTDDNAHPFQTKNIIGAHNGIIYNDTQVGAGEHAVDSEVIFRLLQKHGTNGLKKLQGYAGVWWIDTNQPEYFWLWMDSGELAYWRDKDRTEFVFSSDWKHLVAAGIPRSEIKSVSDGAILRVSLKTLAIKVDHVRMTATPYTHNYGVYNGEWEYFGEAQRSAYTPDRIFCEGCATEVDVGDWLAMEPETDTDLCPYCQQQTLIFDEMAETAIDLDEEKLFGLPKPQKLLA
jgi:asparagine synthetase B (glutamine-hydrolysing)